MENAFRKHLFKVAEIEENLESEDAMENMTEEER